MSKNLLGMGLVAALLALAACGPKPAPAGPPAALGPPGRRIIEITVTEEGFRPDRVTVAKDEPLTFAFTRTTDQTCATEVIVQLGPTDQIEQPLPLNQRVTFDASFATSGTVTYACGMDMVTGVITVK